MGWREDLERAQRAPVDRGRLVAALRTRWSDVEVVAVEPILGGLGSVLHRVVLHGAPVRSLVLRQLLAEFGDDADTLRRELVAHRQLPGRGVPVPVVHWSDPEGVVLGRPAAALQDMPGTPISAALASVSGQQAFAAMVADLARVRTDELPGVPALADVAAHADRFGPPATTSELVDPRAVQARIDAHRRWFVARRQVVHCDLHGGNVLWDGHAVTGVLDWPGFALGVAACDEAYAWLDTCLVLGRAAGDALQLAVDAAREGPPPTPGEVMLWRAVALRRALPTPAPWADAYRAAGIDVADELVEQRFVELVAEEAGGG